MYVIATVPAPVVEPPASNEVSYFTTPTINDGYECSTAFGRGSANFVFAVWYRYVALDMTAPDSSGIAGAGNNPGTNGYDLAWTFGVLRCAGNDSPFNVGDFEFYGSQSNTYAAERDVLLVLRVTADRRASLYANAQRIGSTVGAVAIAVGAAPLRLGGQSRAASGNAMEGGIQGAAYVDGTFTDAQLRAWMLACMDAGGVIAGALAWDGGWSHLDSTPGATWTDFTGNGNDLTRIGATGSMTRTLRLA